MKNLYSEILNLPPHHRLALAAWIIKRERPNMETLSLAGGFSKNTLRKAFRMKDEAGAIRP